MKLQDKNIGKLAGGCLLCAKGLKTVVFVTGICPRKCLYCPLSAKKKNKDVVYFNELKSSENNNHILNDLIKEIKQSNSLGVSLTGGDPLSKFDRTLKIIKQLKKIFGRNFHIHLYTSLELISEDIISKLQTAGLDELRVHPDIFNNKLWNKIILLKGKFKETGVEIPAFPKEEKRIIELINYAKDKVDFFNLNELEYATLYEKEYKKRNWNINNDYSVKGSEKTALNVIKKLKNSKVRIHYCSSLFKDRIQFCNRIKQRAKSFNKNIYKISKEGTLIFLAVYYGNEKEKNNIIEKLKGLKINFEDDKLRKRIIFNLKYSDKIKNNLNNCFLIEEYPTIDRTEVYIEKIN